MNLPVITLLLLFVVGIIQDALCAFYLVLVRDNRYIVASFLSIIITILSYGVWAVFINQTLETSMSGLAVYSVGGGIGTYLGLRKKNHIAKAS